MKIRTSEACKTAATGIAGVASGTVISALVAMNLALSTPARADTACPTDTSPADCYFLDQIHGHIPRTATITDWKMTNRGRQLCGQMEQVAARSGPAAAISQVRETMIQGGLPDMLATILLDDSIHAYCPEIYAGSPTPTNGSQWHPGAEINSNVPINCNGIEAASQSC